MRTVTFGMNISLDGYCDHNLFSPDEEVMEYFTSTMDGVDLYFFGRVMYELMFPYWDDVAKDQSGSPSENEFARRFSAIDRVVVSRSLEVNDPKARVIRSNPVEELSKLKQQPGKNISVDSVSMLPDFIAAGLIDEFKLVVHPGLAGNGRLLLPPGSLTEKLDLKLTEKIHFKSGSVALHYVKQ
ncbi:dihydrofolate reductase family protein [Chitinophaga horti]|uniref:Dihydrofolate reductase family protein n=1 Tax=Chitinophaga horti TaxID=2920382 RepID=A0ABY6J3R9_9BACT|nr:dihydrofolate reductase family protein [Chitinophaga horti]UYQ94150.1 dihydrofolate reductase family protein [Chitinophaga horti]